MVQNNAHAAAASLFGTRSARKVSPFKLAMTRHRDENQISTSARSFGFLSGNGEPNWLLILLIALVCNVAVATAAWYLAGLLVG